MPEPNTPGGSIDPTPIPPGITVKFAFIGQAQVESCKYAWGDEDERHIFGEEGGGYAWLSSSGTIPRWVGEDGGYVSCGVDPGGGSPSPSPGGGGGSTNYNGGNAPPPPNNREKDCMCGCDCNDIATMMARQLAESHRQIESLKDFIQKTAIEQLELNQKQLQAISIDLDLQPVVNRINEVENNLWNGIKK